MSTPKTPRSPRWRRIVVRVAIVVLAFALLVPVGIVIGLQSESVRRAILDSVAGVVEDRTGVRMGARDFRVELARGVVEIEDLRLGAPVPHVDAPFLSVSRVRGVVRWRTLLGDRPIVDSIRLERPIVDLGAPLPTPDAEPGEGGGWPALDVLRFDVTDGRVDGAPAPASLDVWLDRWSAGAIRIRGSLRGDRLQIEDGSTLVRIESGRRDPKEMRVDLAGTWDAPPHAIRVENLRIDGDGLSFEGRGRFDTETAEAGITFSVDADPAALFPDLTFGGHLRGSGDLAIERRPGLTLGGALRVDAVDIPGELARPFLTIDGDDALEVGGTQIDVAVDVELGVALTADAAARAQDEVHGTAEIHWRRGSERRLDAEVRSLASDRGVHLAFRGEIDPAAPGRRQVSGEILAPSFVDLPDGALRSVRLDLAVPDGIAAAARFGVDVAALPPWFPRGRVDASVVADGPVLAPRLQLEGRWTREDGEPLAEVTARSLDAPGLHVRFATSALPAAAGRRTLSGVLRAPGWDRLAEGEIVDGRVEIEQPDIGAVHAALARHVPGLLPDAWDRVPPRLLQGSLSAVVDVAGPVLDPAFDAVAEWAPAPGEAVHLVARGTRSAPTAALTVDHFDVARLDPADPRSLVGRIDASLGVEQIGGGPVANLRLDGRDLAYGTVATMERVHLDVTADPRTIELRALHGTLAAGTETTPVRGTFRAHGVSDTAWPPNRAEATLSFSDPDRGIVPIEASLRMDDDGLVSVRLSDLDLAGLMAWFSDEDEQDRPPIAGTLDLDVAFDPADPVAAVGTLSISDVAMVTGDEAPVALEQTLTIEMRDGRIELPATVLQPTGRLIRGDVPLELSASVDLARDWRPGDDLASLVENVVLDLDGKVDAAVLNPFLAGGVADGTVGLTIRARGRPDTLTADIGVRGPDARVLYRRPYPTRLEALEADVVVRRGEVTLERATARLNGGLAEMTGTWTPEAGLRAHLRFDDARYRVDFNVTTLLRGDLQLEWPATGRRQVAGTVVVERAVLRSPIRLGREVLAALFDVRPESGGVFPLDTIDLDLTVLTDQGILIKNNVADLQADWGEVRITGTAAEPLFDGRVDVKPGSIIMAFGQALRVDEGSFEWSGQPITEPRMVFETTSSLDDPSILKSWRNEFFTPADLGPGRGGTLDFWGQGQTDSGAAWEMVATGAMTQATSASRTQLTFEPLPLFGETTTQARFTIATDLSPNLSFIASTNPRETESQTYILDIHSLPMWRSFRAQVFTNDEKNAGLTVQQTLRLGKTETDGVQDPTLRSKTVEVPEGFKQRRVRRAIAYRKSDPFPTGSGLDVEVDVLDMMQRRGYPSARVEVDAVTTDRDRVDLTVRVDPGERVAFEFEGESLSAGARREIASRYRPALLGERAARDGVRAETVSALRARGFLEPVVEVESAPGVVRVVSEGGWQVTLAEMTVSGVPDDDAARVTGLFNSTLSRVRLAVEAPGSDAAVLRALDRRGFPEARITGRQVSPDGQALTVDIDAGRQRRVAAVEITGLDDEERARLATMLEIRKGDPVRQDRIGLSARRVEGDLRNRGHAEAQVTPQVRPVGDDDPFDVAVRFEVVPGPSYRIAEVRFEGLQHSRAAWVEKVAGLEPGGTYRRRDVAEARARLFRTGVFDRIDSSTDLTAQEPGGEDAVVTFDVKESRRWQLSYGGRWEEEKGISVVADIVNRHSFGIGHLTGIRAILGQQQRNLRLYHVIPDLVGPRSSLELLIEGGREPLTSNVDVQGVEAWAQLTFPLSPRVHGRPYVQFRNPTLIEEEPDPDEPLDDRVTSPLLGWQMAFDSTSRRIGEDRRSGVFAGVDLLGSHEALGSDVTTLKIVGQIKYFLPLDKRDGGRFTWAQFWRGGLSEAVDQEVPFIDRFRVGGEFSVRGYPTNSLGPLGEDGEPLGGEVLFVVNQEIHARVLRTEQFGSIDALAFFDAGNVWLDRQNLGGGLFKSVGVGVRYLSPIGPLRLDFGVPLDRRPEDPSYAVYFGFGSVF